jgi:hypothetical protein
MSKRFSFGNMDETEPDLISQNDSKEKTYPKRRNRFFSKLFKNFFKLSCIYNDKNNCP